MERILHHFSVCIDFYVNLLSSKSLKSVFPATVAPTLLLGVRDGDRARPLNEDSEHRLSKKTEFFQTQFHYLVINMYKERTYLCVAAVSNSLPTKALDSRCV